MAPFFNVKHYTKDEVEELLKISMTDELNIFHNRNKIITNLCRTLLKVWEDKENIQ